MRKFLIPLATAVVLALSCEKTPKEVAVSGVSIDRSTVEMTIGQTVQLSATVTPSDATDQSITWSSTKNSVATVNNNGLVTAVAEGRTTIKARVGGKTSACIVTVKKEIIPVTSISLDLSTLSLTKGESKTLVATVSPANATYKQIIWASSDPNVASVNSEGKVSAVAKGNATITAQVDEVKATCAVTVTVPVESITLNKTELTLKKGESETLVATVKPDDATEHTVTWTSSNSNMASVDANGKVTALSGGNVTIAAKAGGKSVVCMVVVIVPVESVTLNRSSLTLGEGESATLRATVTPKDATDYSSVSWSSTDENVATVDQNGVIHAIHEGSTKIVAKAGDKQATCTVTVIKRVSSISLDQNNLTLFVGNTSTLTVTVLPEDATDKTVMWKSNDTYIATVENGVLKGIDVGRTTITATAGSVSATCNVLVVLDSAEGVSARFHGGQFEMVDDVVKAGGNMIFGIRNFSSETIHVVSVQLIDSQTGSATGAMSIDSDLDSGSFDKWTIPVGDSDIHAPKARFVYMFREKSYTCEAEITPL